MATTDVNPHVKEHNGKYICFADTLTQANTALTERQSGQNATSDLAKASHLMLFGVEDWQQNDVQDFSKNIAKSSFDRIEIFGSTLSEDHQKQIARGFATITATKVDLDNTELTVTGAREIMKSLAGTAVEELNLQGSVKNTAILKSILDELTSSKALKKLDLKINDIKPDSGKAIQEFMKNSVAQDLNLDLFYNDLQKDGADHIAHGLTASTSITKLDLCCNGIGDNGAEAIARALKTNRTLRELKLALNNIGNAGGQAIMDCLYHNNASKEFANPNFALKVLDLSANVMKATNSAESEPLTESLVSVINYGFGLHDFDFTGIELDDEGWARVANAFETSAANFEHLRESMMATVKNSNLDAQFHFDTHTLRMLRFSIVDLMSQERLTSMEEVIWGNNKDKFSFIDWRRKEAPKTEEKKEE